MRTPLRCDRLTLRVVLLKVSPLVARLISVLDDLSLEELHDVLQLVLGWSGQAFHNFRIHEQRGCRFVFRVTEISKDSTYYKYLRFFADYAAKKWPLRGSKSNDSRHKNISGALKARSQGKHKELRLLQRMFIYKTCQIR